jgi:hypothetical protein
MQGPGRPRVALHPIGGMSWYDLMRSRNPWNLLEVRNLGYSIASLSRSLLSDRTEETIFGYVRSRQETTDAEKLDMMILGALLCTDTP